MIFFALMLAAICLSILGHKVPALFIFFFFVSSGFNVIPWNIFEFAFIKGEQGYLYLTFFGIVITDAFFTKKYFKQDTFVKYLLVFALFIIACIIHSKVVVHLSWAEILNTCRYLFLWLAYFIFRNMEKAQLERLLKYLYCATVFSSVLYLLQIVLDEFILIGTTKGYTRLFIVRLPRFYNQPIMLHFFSVMAVYCCPFQGKTKIITRIILIMALFGAFHRSLDGFFLFIVLLGYILKRPRLKQVKVLTMSAVIAFFLITFAGYKLVHSKIFTDLKLIMSGEVAELNIGDIIDKGSTFAFRVAHLLERNQYILEHPNTMFWGAGLISEDSKVIEKMFNFKIGLISKLTGNVEQVATPDIAYSVLFLRFGYFGTCLNLMLFIYLTVFFYKRKKNKYGFFSFLYFILSFGISFFGANLVEPITFLLPLITYNIINKTIENVDEGRNKNIDCNPVV